VLSPWVSLPARSASVGRLTTGASAAAVGPANAQTYDSLAALTEGAARAAACAPGPVGGIRGLGSAPQDLLLHKPEVPVHYGIP
jgi:hypothetical protein